MTILLIALAAFFGAALQAGAGFGYVFLLAPALLIVYSAPVMIILTMITSTALSLLVLFGERRRREVTKHVAVGILGAAVPGLALGVYLLRLIPKPILQIIVGLLVILAAIIQVTLKRHPDKPLRMSPAGYLSGFVSGLMTGSTAMGGPPLALWLRNYKVTRHQIRDTLAVSFLGFNVVGGGILVASYPHEVLQPKTAVVALALLPLVALGHRIGSKLPNRLTVMQFRKLLLLLVLIAATISIWNGVSGL